MPGGRLLIVALEPREQCRRERDAEEPQAACMGQEQENHTSAVLHPS